MQERDFIYDVAERGDSITVFSINNRYTPSELRDIVDSKEFSNWHEKLKVLVLQSFKDCQS